jgi:hypothetical protein
MTISIPTLTDHEATESTPRSLINISIGSITTTKGTMLPMLPILLFSICVLDSFFSYKTSNRKDSIFSQTGANAFLILSFSSYK